MRCLSVGINLMVSECWDQPNEVFECWDQPNGV